MLFDNVMVDQSPQNRKQLGTEDDYTGFRYLASVSFTAICMRTSTIGWKSIWPRT